MSRYDTALEQLDITAWLQDFTEVKYISDTQIKIKDCPNCGNSKFKLYIETSTRLFHCFRCDWGRGISDFCVLLAAISGRTIYDIRLELIRTVAPSPANDLVDKMSSVFENNIISSSPLSIVDLPGVDSWNGIVSQSVRKYALENRGLTDIELKMMRLRNSLNLEANAKKKIQGPFLIFPIIYDGVPVNWQGRCIHDKEPRYMSGNKIASWMWPLDSSFVKIIEEKKEVALVEGVFDALSFWRLGIPGLCTFGKKISDRQIVLLQKLGVIDIYIAWDADAKDQIEIAANRLKSSFRTIRVMALHQPSDKKTDPGDALKDNHLMDWLKDCISKSMDVNSDSYYLWQLSKRLGQ